MADDEKKIDESEDLTTSLEGAEVENPGESTVEAVVEAVVEADDHDTEERIIEELVEDLTTEEQSPDEVIQIKVGEFEQLKDENRELKERIVRQQADFDNIRKRLRRDGEAAGGRAVARFIGPILTELDNFGHALDAANPDAFMDFAQGVTMIRDNLLKVLEGAGIEAIPAEGHFDPAYHEVVAEFPSEDAPKGHIIAVQRGGYRMGEQIVRAAQVVVSKGSENPSAEEEAAAEVEEASEEE